jgi:hypothetical protein
MKGSCGIYSCNWTFGWAWVDRVGSLAAGWDGFWPICRPFPDVIVAVHASTPFHNRCSTPHWLPLPLLVITAPHRELSPRTLQCCCDEIYGLFGLQNRPIWNEFVRRETKREGWACQTFFLRNQRIGQFCSWTLYNVVFCHRTLLNLAFAAGHLLSVHLYQWIL